MNPTKSYLDSSSAYKYRLLSSRGQVHAALEHINIGATPVVYLSRDGGETYEVLGWKLSFWKRLGQGFHGLEWPLAEDIESLEVKPNFVVVRCAQSSDVDIVWREFRYDIKKESWF